MQRNKDEPGSLVLVTWRDSCSPGRKWQDRDWVKDNYTAVTCRSVGWLVRRDKKDLVLCASYGQPEVGDVTAIPSACVVSVKRLK